LSAEFCASQRAGGVGVSYGVGEFEVFSVGDGEGGGEGVAGGGGVYYFHFVGFEALDSAVGLDEDRAFGA